VQFPDACSAGLKALRYINIEDALIWKDLSIVTAVFDRAVRVLLLD